MDEARQILLSSANSPESTATMHAFVEAVHAGQPGPTVGELLTLPPAALHAVGSYLLAHALSLDCDARWAACRAPRQAA